MQIAGSTTQPRSFSNLASEDRDAYELLVRKLFHQLTIGCSSNPKCPTKHCASNGSRRLPAQAAAIAAVQLASQNVKLCPNIDWISNLDWRNPNPFLDSLISAQRSRDNLNHQKKLIRANTASHPVLDTIPASGQNSLENSENKGHPGDDAGETLNQTDVNGQERVNLKSSDDAQSASLIGIRAAKSLMDLPNLFSATIGLPIFQGTPPTSSSSSSGIPTPLSRSPQHSASAATHNSKLRSLQDRPLSTNSSTSSLFEELDTQVISTYLDLSILQSAIAQIRTHADIVAKEGTVDSHHETHDSVAHKSAYFGETIDKSVLPLLKTLRTVFSSPEALNRSFLPPNFNTSSELLGLDVASLEESFKLIFELEPKERVQHTLLSSFEVLASSIHMNIRGYQIGSPKLLRVFMILLENPFLSDPESNGRILPKTCHILGALKAKSRYIITTWLSKYSSSHFLRLLEPFTNYLSTHFYPFQRPDENVIACVKTLSLFYRANILSEPSPTVPLTSFYNHTIASKLNFKDEYKIWKDSLTPPPPPSEKSTTKPPPFSYFSYPFLFDPVSKTRVLHIDAMSQMSLEYEEAVVHQAIVIHAQRFLQSDSTVVQTLQKGLRKETNPYLVLSVRRSHLVQDVLDQLHQCTDRDLKKPVKVVFVGGGEEGLDAGGVQKEFFQVLVDLLLDPAVGMFSYDAETRYTWFKGESLEPERQFELVGMIVGLALYNGVILGINFAPIVYKKLVGEQVGLEDVKIAFPGLGKGLEMLLDWKEEDGDVEDVFCRSFDIEYEVWGKVRTIPLVHGGSDIPVTNSNREEYVDLYINHYVNESVKRQFGAFRRGFHRVCGGSALKMCRAEELEMMICGTNELDFKDLEAGAKYDDGYDANHEVIKNFWSVAHNMSHEHKKELLMFVTASDRVPLKGLGNLVFVIQRNGPDTERLPTALTCFGRLLLPEYSTKEKLENRLITAIENAKGFGLV